MKKTITKSYGQKEVCSGRDASFTGELDSVGLAYRIARMTGYTCRRPINPTDDHALEESCAKTWFDAMPGRALYRCSSKMVKLKRDKYCQVRGGHLKMAKVDCEVRGV